MIGSNNEWSKLINSVTMYTNQYNKLRSVCYPCLRDCWLKFNGTNSYKTHSYYHIHVLYIPTNILVWELKLFWQCVVNVHTTNCTDVGSITKMSAPPPSYDDVVQGNRRPQTLTARISQLIPGWFHLTVLWHSR